MSVKVFSDVGYIAGDKHDYVNLEKSLSSKTYQRKEGSSQQLSVAVINYRLSSKTYETNESRNPAQLLDTISAIVGHSVGGHLTGLVCLEHPISWDSLKAPGSNKPLTSCMVSVIGVSGIYDTEDFFKQKRGNLKLVDQTFGTDENVYRCSSPQFAPFDAAEWDLWSSVLPKRGTGLYKLDGLKHIETLDLDTPYGKPSSPIQIFETESGNQIAFLARHGEKHTLLPSEVPYRSNIAALRHIGVLAILAFSSVGSLQEHIAPGDFVVPDQIIDRTKGVRKDSFFGQGLIGHSSFGEPFHSGLSQVIMSCKDSLNESKLIQGGTLIAMEGPAFSTRAESRLYQSWGGSVINMSSVPEAKLAREAEMAYQLVCMATDYDSWRLNEEPVSTSTVMLTLSKNGNNAALLLKAVLPQIEEKLYNSSVEPAFFTKTGSILQNSIFMPKELISQAQISNLKYMFPEEF
ncbi:S-methyl-5'-thioadenosine phosphorylase [Smittium mucronatum]|uniref:Purine nucleoside phosphorylase n=1 Tax=Smittium mucronatum TaxID=133383 RepID=A0A1R0GXJ8_9FUNG|nr:S-methyl-5'-thioadenosine phosphorylase [Smittium mucronatum]